MTKVAFLGAGKMASAMVDGLLAGGAKPPSELVCHSASGESAARLANRTGIAAAPTLEALLQEADTLVVAFKPQHLAHADPRLATLTKGKLVISVLAGKRLASLAKAFPQARNVVRTMPNTPGQIGAGVTAWCSLQTLTPEDRGHLEALLDPLGRQLEAAESQMDAITAISGSGPGFVFEYAGALRDAAIAAGLPVAMARTLVVETLLGSARLLARTQDEPERLRDQVTSPNGVTYAGLNRLKEGRFRQLIRETVLTAKTRAEELSQ